MDDHERIVLGGGCFWCTEAIFNLLEGVKEVLPGYAGGVTQNPRYEEVSSGDTGHAEVVSVEYDPDRISLEELLDLFFATHNPTTPNRQGNDIGTQYRSIILYTSEDQRALIEEFMDRIGKDFDKPIVTEVKRLDAFYPAEDYHQGYYSRNTYQPYCRFVITPKIKKAKTKLGPG